MDWEEVLELVDQGMELLEDLEENYGDIWARGEEFFDDVGDKLKDVGDSVEDRRHATDKQASAVENWVAAVRKWHPEHRGRSR